MQFKNIVAFVSLAVMVSALPAENLVERTSGGSPQNKCRANQKVNCCDSFEQRLVNGVLVTVGINCLPLNRKSSMMVSSFRTCTDCLSAPQYPMLRDSETCVLQLRRSGMCNTPGPS